MKNLFIDTFMKEETLIIKEMEVLKNAQNLKLISTDISSPNVQKNNAHYEGKVMIYEKKPDEKIFSIPNNGKFIVFHTLLSKVYYQSGHTYFGSWINGHVHGKGTYKDPKTFEYDGHWRNGLFNGWGEIEDFDDGMKYKGQFKENKRHGLGTIKLGEELLRGYFENGQLLEKISDYKGTKEDNQFTYILN